MVSIINYFFLTITTSDSALYMKSDNNRHPLSNIDKGEYATTCTKCAATCAQVASRSYSTEELYIHRYCLRV